MKLHEIFAIARANHACADQLEAAEKHTTLEALLADPRAPQWAYWLRRYCLDLPADVARQAEQVAIQSPEWAYCLRYHCRDLPEAIARQAEQVAIRSPELAYCLWMYCLDLPADVIAQIAEIERKKTGNVDLS